MRKPDQHASVPAPGEGKRGEQGYLGYLLRQAAGAHRLRVDRALADLGVTQPQFVTLTMLAAYPGLSNADLARLALLTPQTLSVIVTNLERAGSLLRKPHAVHGRIQHIELSPRGQALLRRCRDRVHAIETELATGLSASEERAVRRWLVGVATADTAET
ncbi:MULTISPECIES: MarR family transcriptional regulator [unclassified Mesorhizobium]|uniref:MarR family winged helix-turn-helix transcriptional regulator n=1 Tax=unclassified Mesorhizobium TaxID=325217 RepID=UPI000FD79CDC|nr:MULTISPECIES: MarR family transcriptional regulator [unclassified Mesorhizobium]TGR48756.1 MarR family transcriptional regulator [bacterium M00.F.Ca.ET.199.01.1.1]TGU37797.1 MarR family transcriptional regulator [bacterium M00.F.Ca.ET.156.01.1.1]TGV88786.1 MarR family transcriptional regulator [Mesorhizobium sp. M00.F.Ca.ET.149.01.1.1]TGR30444.1 MarR family transcriptional regulator [Mesorhizobium sp. M8A.F.Ca.ET.202.01.1.1]TGR31172.1 MarR family transcriptional regulator [Mesorhizobium sp.